MIAQRNKDIYSFFRTGWQAASRTEPVAYENDGFDPPEGQSWVRVTILDGDSSNPAVGGDWKRTTGLVIVQCFTPVGEGSTKDDLHDAVLNLLENQQTGSYITFKRGTVTNDGTSSDKAWWQARVIVPFRYDLKT